MLAQGYPGTNSKRWNQYVEGVYPSHCSGRGLGPYLFDAWDNRYVDFVAGLGSIILGYSNGRVVDAVQRQCAVGANHSLPTTLEIEVAEQISALVPAAKRIRFLKTGSEACSAAVRIARGITGRRVVLSQGYHGHSDLFTSLTLPRVGVKDDFQILSLDFYEQPTFAKPQEIACIIVEALYLEMSEKWRTYLEYLRKYCTQHGIVLIFDEVITGFRVPDWTVSKMWGIEPDIIVMGKAIANGWPLALVAGKPEVMDGSEYFVSSTFSGEATSLAACQATMQELHRKNFQDLIFYGNRLQTILNSAHPEIRFEGYGTRAMLNTTNPTTGLFMQEMCKAGFLFGKAHFFHFAHMESEVERLVLSAAEGIIEQIKQGKVKLEGQAPQETFKR